MIYAICKQHNVEQSIRHDVLKSYCQGLTRSKHMGENQWQHDGNLVKLLARHHDALDVFSRPLGIAVVTDYSGKRF